MAASRSVTRESGSAVLSQYPQIGQSVRHRSIAHLESLRKLGDTLIVLEVQFAVANLLLNQSPRHQQCRPQLIRFHLVSISSGRRVQITTIAYIGIDE